MARQALDQSAREQLIQQVIAAGEAEGTQYDNFAATLAQDLGGAEGIALSDALGLSEVPISSMATEMRSTKTWSEDDRARYDDAIDRLNSSQAPLPDAWNTIRRIEEKYGVESLRVTPVYEPPS